MTRTTFTLKTVAAAALSTGIVLGGSALAHAAEPPTLGATCSVDASSTTDRQCWTATESVVISFTPTAGATWALTDREGRVFLHGTGPESVEYFALFAGDILVLKSTGQSASLVIDAVSTVPNHPPIDPNPPSDSPTFPNPGIEEPNPFPGPPAQTPPTNPPFTTPDQQADPMIPPYTRWVPSSS